MKQKFAPFHPPYQTSTDALGNWAYQELRKVAEVTAQDASLDKRNVAPAKPFDGLLAYADGTNWNPGAGGEGIYAYYNGTWNRLG